MQTILYVINGNLLPSPKVRIKKITGGNMRWKFLVSLESQLCHVVFFWKLSVEDILLKQTHDKRTDT